MNKLLILLTTLTLSTAFAHTEVTSVTPPDRSVVAAPKVVTLKFSEPIELRFSTFRVMAVPAGKTASVAAALALAEKADSGKLASLPLKGVTLASQVTVPLKPRLKAGAYVIAWKILSEDGHPVTAFSTFRLK
ncbi:hypothetical protein GCM10008959_19530 [Deinococcus seoulensis]|uniref:CopC domain-containing protein n=1 Tax=Deinococcus seoulensis TaxID=1837379 RepID=A0ABQ2RRA0_9DEIO|nr:copper resistance CopC family protein [Deinococcus seoulensis]GGR57921.1 hypothetical protein GCM10008959_19530 [Deinococcus seoulensis]